ncbi:serine/threonine-protein kinase [Streptomyces sp. NPDC127092]|uniref:serine/threonine-protein kinase n=1 Tax=Streptomyces sp. NPDC127092 TaxID=3347135 RepID=UPI003657B7D2
MVKAAEEASTLGTAWLVLVVGALVVRLALLPLLLRTQRAVRQREAAAFSGARSGGADWSAPFFERALMVTFGAGLLTLLANVAEPVDFQDELSVALWPGGAGNPADLGTLFLEFASSGLHGLSYDALYVGLTFCVLSTVLWVLTQKNLLSAGMPEELWLSSRTRLRVIGGFLLQLVLTVVVLPVGATAVFLVFHAVALVTSRRHPPVKAASPVEAAPPVPPMPAFAPAAAAAHAAPTAAAAPPVTPAATPAAPAFVPAARPAPGAPDAPGAPGTPGEAAAPAAVRDLAAHEPRRIGTYQLLGRIGAGGMGTVYLARRDGSATQVALKTIHPELLGNTELLSRFERESEVLSMVSGAYTARVLDSGVDEGRPYLAMELLDGRPLDRHLRELGPLRGPEALRSLALALAAALSAVHRLGLVHRDLKPGNVMLTSAGPRLLDFGIATIVDRTRLTATGAAPGTLGYMAPEQFEDGPAGPAADVWAWACCVVCAAHGDSPFAATGIGAAYRRITEGTPDPAALASVDAVDPALGAAVRQALRTRPADRPADGTALLALLTEGPGHTVPDARSLHEEITRGWNTLPPVN